MRELIIDFSLENPLAGGAEVGYIGENNATTLVIRPGKEILATGCASYAVVFLTKGEVYRSDYFEPAEEIRVSLGAHLTRDYYLNLQIEGYSEENDMIYKSPMVTAIQFLPSINGDVTEFDETEYKLYGQVANNTKARHKHENSEVINALSDENGKLLYNGEPIQGAEKTKTVELAYEDSGVDFEVVTTGVKRFDIITYKSESPVPYDAEIQKIELQINADDCPEWLDIRHMINYDPHEAYIINMSNPFYDEEMGTTVFARVSFIENHNRFFSYISAFRVIKARITYIENTAD